MPAYRHTQERPSSLPIPSSPPATKPYDVYDVPSSPSERSMITLPSSPDTPRQRYHRKPAIASSSRTPAVSLSSRHPAIASSSRTAAAPSSSNTLPVGSPSRKPAVSFSSRTPAAASSSKTPAAQVTSQPPAYSSRGKSLGKTSLAPRFAPQSPCVPRNHAKAPRSFSSASKAPAVSSPSVRPHKTPYTNKTAKAASAPFKATKQHSRSHQQPSDPGHASNEQAVGWSPQLEAEEKHFGLRNDKIAWKKLPRASGSEIQNILKSMIGESPVSFKLYEDIYSRDWLVAQAMLYDLFSPSNNTYGLEPNDTETVLVDMVLTAAKDGKCDALPKRILGLEVQLQRVAAEKLDSRLARKGDSKGKGKAANDSSEDSDESNESNESDDDDDSSDDSSSEDEDTDYGGYKADPWDELEHQKGAQANLDPDRFFNQYFLTNGKPDLRKTTSALRLDGLAEDSERFLKRAARYGLCKWETSTEPRRYCMGWNLQKCQRLAWFTDSKVRERGLRKVYYALRDQCHKDQARGSTAHWDISGQYMITAPNLVHSSVPNGPFTLNIQAKLETGFGFAHPGGFSLGVMEGSLFLGSPSPVLDKVIADAEAEDFPSARRKRKKPPTELHAHRLKKRASSTWGSSHDSSRPPPQHYEVRMRGREAVGDNKPKIFHQPRSGFIRFKDDTFTSFHGKVYMGPELEMVQIYGVKYSHVIPEGTQVPSWLDFSQRAAELEVQREDAPRSEEGDPEEEPPRKQSKSSKKAVKKLKQLDDRKEKRQERLKEKQENKENKKEKKVNKQKKHKKNSRIRDDKNQN